MKKLIVFIFMVLMSASVSANIDYTDYDQASKIGRRSLNKKSVRMIIREILDRRKAGKESTPNTIPIPLYDSIDYDKMKNLA